MRQMGRLDNFGIRRVERLDGNVGYLDVRRVAVPANAGPAIGAAMELVAGTYALIIDLRHNGGGAPEGVVFWCSYLLTEQPTHLNDIFHADTGAIRSPAGRTSAIPCRPSGAPRSSGRPPAAAPTQRARSRSVPPCTSPSRSRGRSTR
jgi:hypothetical protein